MCFIFKLLQYEYEMDESGKKIVLGRGSFGIVYQARDLVTQVRIAVKEIPEENIGLVSVVICYFVLYRS